MLTLFPRPDDHRRAAPRRPVPCALADWLDRPPALSLRDGDLLVFDCRGHWPGEQIPALLEHLLIVPHGAGLPGDPARNSAAGQISLLPAGETAWLRLPLDHPALVLGLRPRLLHGSQTTVHLRACAGRADAVTEGIARTLRAAGQDLGGHLTRALVAHLCAHHAQDPAPQRAGLGQLRLRRVLDHLHGRLDQPIDLAEAARVAGCSVSHFAHLFKAAMGVSPMRYLRERRMVQARELVETTALSISEIGLRVGIPEPAQFSQAFRAHWKAPPSQLRRQPQDVST